MDLRRIGDKIISMTRINDIIAEVINLRQQGFSQAEVAKKFGIDRTFVSRLENLGEIRKGKTMALIGFPIKNAEEIKNVALSEGVDFVMLMNDKERWDFVYQKSGIELLNEIMNLLYKVRQYDLVIILGSDRRLKLFKALLDNEVISINIGKSPIKKDVYLDPEEFRETIKKVKKGDNSETRG